MRVDIRKKPELKNFQPFDLDNGRAIKFCAWADDETGKYGVYESDSNGTLKRAVDDLGRPVRAVKICHKKGHIRLVDLRDKGQLDQLVYDLLEKWTRNPKPGACNP